MLIAIIVSCQHEGCEKISSEIEFLTINHDITGTTLTTSEKSILQKALLRLDFVKGENGSYSIVQKSGKEVRISEPIYNFFKNIFEKSAKKNLITRMMIDEDTIGKTEDGRTGDDDCVIYTIVAILHDMNEKQYDAQKVRKELEMAGYYIPGKGTRLGSLKEALRLFFNVYSVDPEDYADVNPSQDFYFVVKQTRMINGQYSYHAETVQLNGNGGFMCRDDQAVAMEDTTSFDFFVYEDVCSLFRLKIR